MLFSSGIIISNFLLSHFLICTLWKLWAHLFFFSFCFLSFPWFSLLVNFLFICLDSISSIWFYIVKFIHGNTLRLRKYYPLPKIGFFVCLFFASAWFLEMTAFWDTLGSSSRFEVFSFTSRSLYCWHFVISWGQDSRLSSPKKCVVFMEQLQLLIFYSQRNQIKFSVTSFRIIKSCWVKVALYGKLKF